MSKFLEISTTNEDGTGKVVAYVRSEYRELADKIAFDLLVTAKEVKVTPTNQLSGNGATVLP